MHTALALYRALGGWCCLNSSTVIPPSSVLCNNYYEGINKNKVVHCYRCASVDANSPVLVNNYGSLNTLLLFDRFK